MGTFSQVSIKHINLSDVQEEIEKFLNIGRREIFDEPKDWFYFDKDNNYKTIIISQEESFIWQHIVFDLYSNIYHYDKLLMQISKKLATEIILVYYQSTGDEGRFAKFKDGNIIYSFCQKFSGGEFRVIDNFGQENIKINEIKDLKLNSETYAFNYDLMNSFLRSESCEYMSLDGFYLHLEDKN